MTNIRIFEWHQVRDEQYYRMTTPIHEYCVYFKNGKWYWNYEHENTMAVTTFETAFLAQADAMTDYMNTVRECLVKPVGEHVTLCTVPGPKGFEPVCHNYCPGKELYNIGNSGLCRLAQSLRVDVDWWCRVPGENCPRKHKTGSQDYIITFVEEDNHDQRAD